MYEVKASASSLNTEKSFVGRSVIGFCIYDLAVLDKQVILTSCRTVRAGSKNFLVNLVSTVFLSSFHGERTGRTCLYTVSAGLTGAVCPETFTVSDHRLETTFQSCDRASSYDLVTGVDTSVAQDTEAWIIGEKFVGIIDLSTALCSCIT